MSDSAMDTDAMLDMSLDDLISKAKTSKSRGQPGSGGGSSGGGGGGGGGRAGARVQVAGGRGHGTRAGGRGRGRGGAGKIVFNGRVTRRQQSLPYTREVPSNGPLGQAESRVYVGNLAWGVSWKELKDFMAQAGRVVRADVGIDPATGKSKASQHTPTTTVSKEQYSICTVSEPSRY